MNSSLRSRLLAVLLFLSTAAPAAEFREIDSPAGPGSLAPSLAELDDDRLILTWIEPAGDGHALMYSVLEADRFGPARRIARGDDWFVNWADTPGLFVLPGGDWVAHWLVKSGPSTYAYDVVMARSADDGASWSATISPHRDGTPTEHGFVSYFADTRDSVGVTWLDGRRMARAEDGEGAMTLRTAVLDEDGRPTAEALLDERVCDCCQTASAMTAEGPLVVYRDRSEGEIRDHYVVRRAADGWTEPERLYEDGWRIGGCPVNGPAVVAKDDRVAVAWFTMGGNEPLVRVALSSDAGRSFELVDTLGKGTAVGRVDLALTSTGFLMSWVDRVDRSGALFVIGYDWQGRRLWERRVGGVDAGRASGFPRLGLLPDCRPVAAWTGRDGDEQRIRIVRIVAPEACGDRPQG